MKIKVLRMIKKISLNLKLTRIMKFQRLKILQEAINNLCKRIKMSKQRKMTRNIRNTRRLKKASSWTDTIGEK